MVANYLTERDPLAHIRSQTAAVIPAYQDEKHIGDRRTRDRLEHVLADPQAFLVNISRVREEAGRRDSGKTEDVLRMASRFAILLGSQRRYKQNALL